MSGRLILSNIDAKLKPEYQYLHSFGSLLASSGAPNTAIPSHSSSSVRPLRNDSVRHSSWDGVGAEVVIRVEL